MSDSTSQDSTLVQRVKSVLFGPSSEQESPEPDKPDKWPDGTHSPPITPHELIEEYHYKGKTLGEIAEEQNCSTAKLSMLMSEEMIPTRHRLATRGADYGFERWDSELYQYLDYLSDRRRDTVEKAIFEDRTFSSISEDYDTTGSSIGNSFRKAMEQLKDFKEHDPN